MFGKNSFAAITYATAGGDELQEAVLASLKQIAVDQHQGGDDYPLVGPSELLEALLADAWLHYVDSTSIYKLPFKIDWLYGFGTNIVAVPVTPVHSHDLVISDANDVVVFDTRTVDSADFQEKDWGSNYLILQWLKGDEVLRIVKYKSTVDLFDIYGEPISAVLDSRTLEQAVATVRSIRVGLTQLKGENVVLKNGFNTELTTRAVATQDGGRNQTKLVFSAAPGSGFGRFGPACSEDDPFLRRINGTTAGPRGNFTLDATGCYRLNTVVTGNPAPDEAQVANHRLQLGNDCGPCCECDDFVKVYEGLRKLRDRYADLIDRAHAIRDLYTANIDRFEAAQACRAEDKLRTILLPHRPNQLGVSVGYCNNSSRCEDKIVLHISFEYTNAAGDTDLDNVLITANTTYTGTPEVLCDTVFRGGNVDPDRSQGGRSPKPRPIEVYRLGGSWPHFWGYFDGLNPGGMGQLVFQVKFPDALSSDTVEMVVDAYSLVENASVSPGTSPVPGYVLADGPLTAEAESLRLVSRPIKDSAALLPYEAKEYCNDDEVSQSTST